MRTQISYGISRPNPNLKSRDRKEHSNGKAVIYGSINDRGFHQLVCAHVEVVHPGWTLSGYAHVGWEVTPEELEVAFEAGYRAHEKGMNIQMALETFRKVFK